MEKIMAVNFSVHSPGIIKVINEGSVVGLLCRVEKKDNNTNNIRKGYIFLDTRLKKLDNNLAWSDVKEYNEAKHIVVQHFESLKLNT